MRTILALLLFTGVLSAEEIPPSRVSKVSHQEGFTVQTPARAASLALIWRKGQTQPIFGMVVDGRYFTVTHPRGGVTSARGRGVEYVLDEPARRLTIVRGKRRTVEKITRIVDS